MSEIKLTRDVMDFGEGIQLTDLEKVCVEIPRLYTEELLPHFARVFGNIVGECEKGFIVYNGVFGFLGPIPKNDLIFVNYYHNNNDSPTLH